jgi:hypothetical protein
MEGRERKTQENWMRIVPSEFAVQDALRFAGEYR